MERTIKEWEAYKPESVEFEHFRLHHGKVLSVDGRVKATGLPLSWGSDGKCVWEEYDVHLPPL